MDYLVIEQWAVANWSPWSCFLMGIARFLIWDCWWNHAKWSPVVTDHRSLPRWPGNRPMVGKWRSRRRRGRVTGVETVRLLSRPAICQAASFVAWRDGKRCSLRGLAIWGCTPPDSNAPQQIQRSRRNSGDPVDPVILSCLDGPRYKLQRTFKESVQRAATSSCGSPHYPTVERLCWPLMKQEMNLLWGDAHTFHSSHFFFHIFFFCSRSESHCHS